MQSRRTNLVLAAVRAVASGGQPTSAPGGAKDGFTQSDIGAYLRAQGEPMSAWEVRGELTNLERAGEVHIEPATAIWHLASGIWCLKAQR